MNQDEVKVITKSVLYEITRCDFCGAFRRDCQLLIKGKSAHICDICTTVVWGVLQDQVDKRENQQIRMAEQSKVKLKE